MSPVCGIFYSKPPASPNLLVPLGALFRTFWVWQMGQTGKPGCPQCCSNLVPTHVTKYYAIEAYFIIFDPILGQFVTILTLKKGPIYYGGCLLLCSNIVVPPPTQNGPSDSKPICGANMLFFPILGTLWPLCGHIYDILGLANGPNWSALKGPNKRNALFSIWNRGECT